MKNIKMFLKIDAVIQKILLLLTFFSIMAFPLIGLALIILGGWQLLSGVIVGVTLSDRKRGRYIVFSICYLLVLWAISNSDLLDDSHAPMILMSAMFIVIPIGIAAWYLRLTIKTLNFLNKEEFVYLGTEGRDDILDSEEMFEHRAGGTSGE